MKLLPFILSFSVGYLSLSQEIVWVRVIGFAFQSTPRAFSFVLSMFLAGIAFGAWLGKVICERKNPATVAGWLLLIAATLDLLSPQAIIAANNLGLGLSGLGLLCMLSACAKGTLFPIVHHLGSRMGDHIGRSVSKVYFSNIAGSTLGPLLTGFIIMDMFSMEACFRLIGSLTLLLSAFTLIITSSSTSIRTCAILIACSSFGLLASIAPHAPWLASELANTGNNIRYLIENRHGVIHVIKQGEDDDIVFGGNVYDGRTNISLLRNSNKIDRAYLLHVIQPKPENVLVIGLSTGAWTRVITANLDIKSIDVVEINPGYIELIKRYKQLSPLLDDKRLHVHIDDGRRWLRQHAKMYDMIVMNTTFHWRANSTNLLSTEMLELIRAHLAPGGIIAFNSTGSDDAFKTASEVFKNTYRFRNFIYASDHDFRPELAQAEVRLKKLSLDGKNIFQETGLSNTTAAIAAIRDIQFVELSEVEKRSNRPLEIITDQNMITEFKYGK